MQTDRRTFLQLSGLAGVAGVGALGGCSELSDTLQIVLNLPDDSVFRPPSAQEIDLPTHVLNRLSWGPRPGDYDAITSMGVEAYIEQQLDHGALNDAACDWRTASIESVHEPAAEMYEYSAEALLLDKTRYKLLRGIHSRRQLFEVMVDFWTDHFNIASEKDHCRWLKAADDRDVIRRHALGNFREMLHASATSAAMLIYLDGHDNKVESPGDPPNENYARELLELHTMGVRGGYTQHDVMEVARCLSGWTYENRPFLLRAARVEFDPARHDKGEKTVLGHTIPAGGGAEDLDRVLDILCAHPATARYIAEKLYRRFVATDRIDQETVERVAGAFTQSQGDIPAVLRELFSSEAFLAARGNLLKRPLRYVISACRATDARTNCPPAMVEALERMGHAPFQYPSPDGYPLDPEPWMGTLLWRWNFAAMLTSGSAVGSINAAQLEARCGGRTQLGAHLLGRQPDELESSMLDETTAPLALLLAGPAFQMH